MDQMPQTSQASAAPVQPVHDVPFELREMVKRVLLGHVGEANPIRREQLAHEVVGRLGLGSEAPSDMDRRCRRAVEWLRRNDRMGALIASVASPAGYWIVGSAEELERSLAQRERAAKTALQTCSLQRRRGLEALKALPLEQGQLFPTPTRRTGPHEW
ncbi:MAG TPA: hypothetical protein DCP69_02615 [Candidatus Omnitrophica bacterium]|nr:hypothetical protein [Candidatus Omnitrophota bacterium]